MDDHWLTAHLAAAYLTMSTSTLGRMRRRGHGPRYYKLGKRGVAYKQDDLDDWIESHKRTGGDGPRYDKLPRWLDLAWMAGHSQRQAGHPKRRRRT